MATEETLQKLREIGKKLREARETYCVARDRYANNEEESSITLLTAFLAAENEVRAQEREAGRICETEL